MGDDAAPGPALHLETKQPRTATPGTRCAGEAKFYLNIYLPNWANIYLPNWGNFICQIGKIKISFPFGGSERSFKHIFLKIIF